MHFSEPQIEDLEVCLKYMDYLTIEHVEVKSDDIHEIAYVHELEATV